MIRSSEKPLAAAGVMAVLALCYQAQAPQWIFGGLAAMAGAGTAFWFSLEKRAAAWMPDAEFPNWLLTQMS